MKMPFSFVFIPLVGCAILSGCSIPLDKDRSPKAEFTPTAGLVEPGTSAAVPSERNLHRPLLDPNTSRSASDTRGE